MRWILVFLFLYLVPLVIVFKNYKNFKRSCLYSGIYVVLVTTIVITNVYISGLNKIKENLYYQSYVNETRYNDKYVSKSNENIVTEKEVFKETKNDDGLNENYVESDDKNDEQEVIKEDSSEELAYNEQDSVSGNQELKPHQPDIKEKTDKDIIFDFKKQIYDIETIALVPMRDCMPYTRNISENIQNIVSIKEELEYASDKCSEVIQIYENIEIPELSNEEDTQVLEDARNDVKKAYELRELAMQSSVKLVDSKNPKYIGKITEYLKLSDTHIANFKERLTDLNNKIKE